MTTAVLDEKIIEMEKEAESQVFTTNQRLKISVNTEVLKNALKKVGGAVSSKTTIEVLKGIYFYATDENIILRASNSDYTIETKIADLEAFNLEGEEGGLVFPGKHFADSVSRLNGKTTTITIDKLQATIQSKGAKIIINGTHPDEFPKPPAVKEESTFSISPDVLAHMYYKTIYATSKSEVRPVLKGIYHEIKGRDFMCVATDAHRLARIFYHLNKEHDEMSVVVPAVSIAEILKQLKYTEQVVNVYFDQSTIVYDFGDSLIYSHVLNDKYPDVRKAIPPKSSTSISFLGGTLKEVFARASLYVNDSGKNLATILVKPSLRQVRIVSDQNEIGLFQEDLIPVEASGQDVKLKFNVRYMTDLLNMVQDDEEVVLNFVSSMAPLVIQVKGENEKNLDLIVPIKPKDNTNEVIIDNFNPPLDDEGEDA